MRQYLKLCTKLRLISSEVLYMSDSENSLKMWDTEKRWEELLCWNRLPVLIHLISYSHWNCDTLDRLLDSRYWRWIIHKVLTKPPGCQSWMLNCLSNIDRHLIIHDSILSFYLISKQQKFNWEPIISDNKNEMKEITIEWQEQQVTCYLSMNIIISSAQGLTGTQNQLHEDW